MLHVRGISPLTLQRSAARLLACRCETGTSRRPFTRPHRRICYQTAATGSTLLPCLFSSAALSPFARSAPVSILGCLENRRGLQRPKPVAFRSRATPACLTEPSLPVRAHHPFRSKRPAPPACRKFTVQNARFPFAPHRWIIAARVHTDGLLPARLERQRRCRRTGVHYPLELA